MPDDRTAQDSPISPTPAGEVVARIHAAGARVVLVVTGGGTAAIGRLCGVAGASSTVVEALVPYSAASLTAFLSGEPPSACSEETARAMAMAAWRRCRSLDPARADDAVGLGVTAALVTTHPKRGEHRVHAALQSATRTAVLTLTLEKGRRSRAEEEEVAAQAAVSLLADTLGVRLIDLAKTPPGVQATIERFDAPAAWVELLSSARKAASIGPVPAETRLMFPGSFNPPHAGHERMAHVAEARVGAPAVRELSVTNVDKPPLDFLAIHRRVEALGDVPLLLTDAPTFLEKAQIAPGCVFAVGADTAERIGRGRYYASDAERDAAIAAITRLGCRFLVFGRVEGGRFRELPDLDLPEALRALCDGVSEGEFREDLSSSSLRR
jgi:nicotinamide mononucleotide (NMN) deamidase PncC